jgi:N-acyl-L-homoserine lactone synthetase
MTAELERYDNVNSRVFIDDIDPTTPVIPEDDPDTYFSVEEDRRTDLPYFVGIVAVRDCTVSDNLWRDCRRIRADVYIDEKHFLPPEAREDDGGESDVYDAWSTQFTASRRTDGEENQVLGTARLILKTSENNIPAEDLFGLTVPVGSAEASRFIARCEDRVLQHKVALSLIRGMTFESLEQGTEYIYAIVEEELYRYFLNIGLPFEPLTESAWLEEFESYNRVIRVKTADILSGIEEKDKTRKPHHAMAPFFKKVEDVKGLGHFGPEFV